MKVFIRTYKYIPRTMGYYYNDYETIFEYMDVEWEFTKRLNYIARTLKDGERRTELFVEIKELYTSKAKNPNYCKYYGDRRKFIDIYATHWISYSKFEYDLSVPETEEIYECA